MRELAVAIQNDNKRVTVEETIRAVKEAGFKDVFVQWYDKDWEYSQQQQIDLCKELGLNIIFAHLGYTHINAIWEDNKTGDEVVKQYQQDIKECKENGIDMVVMHLTDKLTPPPYNEIGLMRIKQITEYAKQLGVKVAFENTRIKGYLEYVLSHIKDDNVGICFDVGHYHAHFKDEFNFNFFKDRIFAVHLHDNDQTDDLHLLPFEGTINWEYIIKKLKECNYTGPVTLELCYRYHYLNMSLVDFYQKGYEIGIQLSKMMDK